MCIRDRSSVLLGAELASGMSMKNGILSVIVGSFFMAILYTICAVVGSSTRDVYKRQLRG